MNSILTSDIFFFITSIAILVLTVIFSIAGIYLVKILKDFKEVSQRLTTMVRATEDEFEDIYTRLTESWLFKLLFARKRSVRKREVPKS